MSAACTTDSLFYLSQKKLYLCSLHRDLKYSEEEAIRLVPPESAKMLLKVIDYCRKEVGVSLATYGNLVPASDCSSFNLNLQESLTDISSRLKDCICRKQYFKLEGLLREAKQLEDLLMNDKVFLKFSAAKNWKEAFDGIEGVREKTIDEIIKDLDKKYANILKITVKKLQEQRHDIQKRKDEEKTTLKSQLTSKNKTIRDLKNDIQKLKDTNSRNLKEKEKNHKNNMKNQKLTFLGQLEEKDKIRQQDVGRYKETIEALKQEIKQLNQGVSVQKKGISKSKQFRGKPKKNFPYSKEETKQEVINTSKYKAVVQESSERTSFSINNSSKPLGSPEEIFKQESEPQIETYSKQELREVYGSDSYYYYAFKESLKGKDMEILLYLNYLNKEELRFLENLKKKIPDLKCLKIANCEYEDLKTVNSFLKSYFPDKVGSFYFNDESSLSPIEECMEELIKISSKVSEDLFLYNFSMSQEQLETLISLNKNKRKLGFIRCKIKIFSVPDFGDSLEGSTLELLDLTGCGHENLSDWEDNDTHFENLVKGLAQSEDMKKNLENISVENCELPQEEPIKIFKKYKFEKAVKFNTPKPTPKPTPPPKISQTPNPYTSPTSQNTHSSSNPADPKDCTIF
ncbi:unnamed protein product [Moneuplotes crassus]|uniref:Uncharacterized protein n=1 Tax=Euplotes crassus TaxID=5936 RepID=A0AAD2DC35_EUPCR|nr:unnamed protein product [Moneuplotes crassus]